MKGWARRRERIRTRRCDATSWWRCALAVSLAALGCGPRTRSPTSCTPGACGEGQSCLVASCRPANSEVVATQARRVVLPATQLVALCSGSATSTASGVMTFRSPACRHPTLLLRFDAPWGPDARVAAAYLVLVAARSGLSSGGPTALEVAPVLEPWSAATVSLRPPGTGRPAGRLLVPSGASESGTLRIEVTAMVSAWAQRKLDDHGVALTADIAPHATFALSTHAGPSSAAATLDVYLR